MLKKNKRTKNYTFQYTFDTKYSVIRGTQCEKELKVTRVNENNELYFTLTTTFLIMVKVLNQLKKQENFKEVINRPFILSLLSLETTSYSHNFSELYRVNLLELNKSGTKDCLVLAENSKILFGYINSNNELKKIYLDLRNKIMSMYNPQTKVFKSLMQLEREKRENKNLEEETPKQEIKEKKIMFDDVFSLN